MGVIPIHRDESDVAAIRTKRERAARAAPSASIRRVPAFYRAPEPNAAMGGLGLLATMSHCPVLPIAIVTKAHKPAAAQKRSSSSAKPLTEADFRRLGDNPRKPEIAAFCFSEVARLYEEAYATL